MKTRHEYSRLWWSAMLAIAAVGLAMVIATA